LELHKVKTGKNKFENNSKYRNDNPSKSFRNSRDDRSSRYSRDDRGESATVTCADCGIECKVPFVPKTDKPVYCSDCFRQSKSQYSESDSYSRDDRSSRYSRDDRSSRYSRDDRRSSGKREDKRSKSKEKLSKKQESFFSGGSEKFYNTLKEKLFENLGGKVCSSCGFKDERALGFRHIDDHDSFDNVRRGGFASSWGKYISNPELAREELKILCLNCNELSKSNSRPEKKAESFKKKKKRFPR